MLYRTCFECRITICILSLCSASLKNTFLSFIFKVKQFFGGGQQGPVSRPGVILLSKHTVLVPWSSIRDNSLEILVKNKGYFLEICFSCEMSPLLSVNECKLGNGHSSGYNPLIWHAMEIQHHSTSKLDSVTRPNAL